MAWSRQEARGAGARRRRLDASFCLDEKKRACVVNAGTEMGRHIACIFTGFLTREFGEEPFKVERLRRQPGLLTAGRTHGLMRSKEHPGRQRPGVSVGFSRYG